MSMGSIYQPGTPVWLAYVVSVGVVLGLALAAIKPVPLPPCAMYLFAVRGDTTFYEVHCIKPQVLRQEIHP